MNLEGFVSFPYCVACGGLLETPTEETLPLWRRPLRTAVWTSLLGAAIVALVVIAANGLRHDIESEAAIVVLTPRQATVRAGEPFSMVVRVDVMNTDGRGREEPLRGVRLRIVNRTLRRFQLIEIRPTPDSKYEIGPAQYYTYNRLERGSQLTLVLRALRLGRQPFNARLYSVNQTSAGIDVDIRVRPAPVVHSR